MKIYLVFAEAELTHFVLVTALDAFSLAAGYVIAYKLQNIPLFYKKFDLTIAKKLLTDSWPLILSTIVVMIYMRIDQIMIKEILGEYEAGVYSAAVRLSEAFYFIPMLITASLFPAIINAKKQSIELYKRHLQSLYTFMAWLSISITLPLTFLADWFVFLLFGQEYREAGQVLVIHVWSSIFVFLGVSFSQYLIAENLPSLQFKRTLLGAVSNLLLNHWLIPIYGVAGAAFATLLAQFMANLVFDAFDKRLHQQLKMKIESIFMPWKAFR